MDYLILGAPWGNILSWITLGRKWCYVKKGDGCECQNPTIRFPGYCVNYDACETENEARLKLLQNSFENLDKDGFGFVTKLRFRKGAKRLLKYQEDRDERIRNNKRNKRINQYFDLLDKNDDNKLNFEEFKATQTEEGWWSKYCLFSCFG